MSEQSPRFETTPRRNPFDTLNRIVNDSYFIVNDQRASEFLHQDRSTTKFHADLFIPIGRDDFMPYKGEVVGGVSDRPISSYQIMLFPDVFQKPTYAFPESSFDPEIFLQEAVPIENPKPVFGGIEQAFRQGNVVLDIGSGEAVADIQLSKKFPLTTIIGTDILYNNKKIFLHKIGFQLTYGDWRSLNRIPNASIDTIISCQGVAMWGLGPKNPIEDKNKIIQTLNRISKHGTIIRFDIKNDFLCRNIGSNWEISEREDVFIAKRK